MRGWLGVALLLSATAVAAQVPATVQEALLRVKPAVALVVAEVAAEVTARCSPDREVRVKPEPYRETGTGWFVDAGGSMVTSARVVRPAHRPPRWLVDHLAERAVRTACLPVVLERRGLEPGQRPDLEERLIRRLLVSAVPTAKTTLAPSISVILPNGRRLAAAVAKYSPPVGGEAISGRDLALLRVEAVDVPVLTLADASPANIGDAIHIIGFPGVVMSHELLNASAKLEASVTSGAVSGFKQDRANQPVIQTDASVAVGIGGGPAVNRAGEVVGVVTFVAGDAGARGESVQGFNFLIPTATVREFLGDTGAKPGGPSRFNAAWYAGLRDFFAGRYSRAAPHFDDANRLVPDLPDVQRIAAENRERIATEPLLPWGSVATVLLALSGVAYGVMLVRRWRRNRFRVSPAEVVRLIETSARPPVIVDVRDTATYAQSPVRIPGSLHITPEELASSTVATLPVDADQPVIAYCT